MRLNDLVVSVLAALLLMLGGCEMNLVTASETRDQYTAHIAGSIIDVQGTNGRIEIKADPNREDVHLQAVLVAGGSTSEHAEQRLAETVLSMTRDTDRTLSITAEFPSSMSHRDRADLTITLPGASELRVNNTNGGISVSGMESTLTVTSTNGTITVEDHHGEASASTSNGRVSFTRHTGPVSVQTTNGRVTFEDHDGSVEARTINGRITVHLKPTQRGPLLLRTTNGRITATIGSGFAGEMTMRSNNGSLTVTDTAGNVDSKSIERRRGTLVFKNDGEASELRTTNGSITVRTSE